MLIISDYHKCRQGSAGQHAWACTGLEGNMHGPDLGFSVNLHGPGLNKLSNASTEAARVERQLTCLTCDARVERQGPLGSRTSEPLQQRTSFEPPPLPVRFKHHPGVLAARTGWGGGGDVSRNKKNKKVEN